jgi:hypothetical protein
MLRFSLKPFLESHQISAYQLVQATKGKLSESTVYGMSRKPLQRVDLGSAGLIIQALRELTDEPVQFQDLLEEFDVSQEALQNSGINPKYAHLIENAKPFTKDDLDRVWSEWTPEELDADKKFWSGRERERELLAQLEDQE